jgi:hypothetical protein
VPQAVSARTIFVLLATGIALALAYVALDPVALGPESAVDRADIVANSMTTLGLLAAGVWALFTFLLFRSAVSSLEMTIRSQAESVRSDARILMIDVGLRNTGRVVVVAGSFGCRLWVRRLPLDVEIGHPLNLDAGDLVVDGFDLLARYDKTFAYEIEPGAEYHEFCALPVSPGELFAVQATFYFGAEEDDALTERRLAFVD